MLAEFLALKRRRRSRRQPEWCEKTYKERVPRAYLVSGDAQLGLARLPGSVTVGDGSGTPGSTSLDPVNDGQSGVGVSTVRPAWVSRKGSTWGAWGDDVQRDKGDSVVDKEGNRGQGGSLLSTVLSGSRAEGRHRLVNPR